MLLGSILLALAWAALQGDVSLANLLAGYIVGYDRQTSLADMLDLADQRAKTWLNAVAVEDPVQALYYYDNARLYRREHERALTAVREARELADPNDVADQIVLDQAEAYALALAGETARARTLLDRAHVRAEAIQLTAPMDNPLHGEACVLRELGDVEGARRLLQGLVELSMQRGFQRVADRYRRDLAALDGSP